MGGNDTLERLNAICAEVGFDLERSAPELAARLRVLAERGQTANDCERMTGFARAVFAYRAAQRPAAAFSAAERRIVVLGCVLSDIGKTGPKHADASAQRAIADMFAVEGVRDETQPVASFFDAYFPKDAERRRRDFQDLGLDPRMSLRAFWNLHSQWTLEILESSSAPPEAVAGAATHHLLDGINPSTIVGADDGFTRAFGDNTAFDRAEKLIIVLDKYDALLRRGRRSHEQAIAWLRDRVQHSARFHDDAEFLELIEDLHVCLAAG